MQLNKKCTKHEVPRKLTFPVAFLPEPGDLILKCVVQDCSKTYCWWVWREWGFGQSTMTSET